MINMDSCHAAKYIHSLLSVDIFMIRKNYAVLDNKTDLLKNNLITTILLTYGRIYNDLREGEEQRLYV